MARRPRPKPDFSAGCGGWVDPDFFPAAVRREAALHLGKSNLSEDQRSAFLTFANDMAQMIMDDDSTPGAAQREQIARIEEAADRLLSALGALKHPAMEALQAHTDYLTYGSAPPVNLPESVLQAIKPRGKGELLNAGWDWAHALQQAADYAASKYELGKDSKPDLLRARGYVSLLADHVKRMTGKPPPKDPASWFACVMACLGEPMGLSIGARVVASGIKAIR